MSNVLFAFSDSPTSEYVFLDYSPEFPASTSEYKCFNHSRSSSRDSVFSKNVSENLI